MAGVAHEREARREHDKRMQELAQVRQQKKAVEAMMMDVKQAGNKNKDNKNDINRNIKDNNIDNNDNQQQHGQQHYRPTVSNPSARRKEQKRYVETETRATEKPTKGLGIIIGTSVLYMTINILL